MSSTQSICPRRTVSPVGIWFVGLLCSLLLPVTAYGQSVPTPAELEVPARSTAQSPITEAEAEDYFAGLTRFMNHLKGCDPVVWHYQFPGVQGMRGIHRVKKQRANRCVVESYFPTHQMVRCHLTPQSVSQITAPNRYAAAQNRDFWGAHGLSLGQLKRECVLMVPIQSPNTQSQSQRMRSLILSLQQSGGNGPSASFARLLRTIPNGLIQKIVQPGSTRATVYPSEPNLSRTVRKADQGWPWNQFTVPPSNKATAEETPSALSGSAIPASTK